MPTLTIRDLPYDLVDRLKTKAKQNGRSMEQEARKILEQRLADRTELLSDVAVCEEGANMTAMAELSDEIILDRLMDVLNAIKSKDDVKAKEIAHTIPLTPTVAKQAKHYMTKEAIYNLGFDMSLVEAELGKDWFDEP